MPFDFGALLNNPAFNFGLSLMGGANTQTPLLSAQTAFQNWQAGQRAQQQLAQQGQLQQAQLGEYQALAGLHGAQTAELLQKRAIINNLLRKKGILTGPSGDQPPPQQQAPQPDPFAPGRNPFNGIPNIGPNERNIGAMPQPGSVLQEDGSSVGNPVAQAFPVQPGTPSQFAQTGMSPLDAAAGGAQQPPVDLVNSDAQLYSLAGFPQLAGFYNEASKPIVLPNGGVQLRDRPDGGVRFAPGSLESMKQVEEMQAGVKGQYGSMEIPLSNGQKVTVSPTEFRMMQQGITPPRLQGALGTPSAAGSGAPAASSGAIGNNNFGNLRPQGATTGFQNFATPEAGLAALDQNLQAYGKHGINTLAGVITRWAPPSENNTSSYIAAASKRLGIAPNEPIDLGNPAVRQLVGSAIMLQEHGPKAFVGNPAAAPAAQAAPAIGITRKPENQIQANQDAEQWGKWNMLAQENAVKAAGRQSRMAMLGSYLEKAGKTGLAGPPTLAFYKMAQAAGLQIPESANYAEAAASIGKALSLEMRDPSQGGGLPGQMSNYEDRLVQSMVANIDKLPGANKILINAYQRLQQRNIKIAETMREYRKQNGGIVDEGVMPHIIALQQSDPIFTLDETHQLGADKSGIVSPVPPAGVGPGQVRGLGTNSVTGKILGPGNAAPSPGPGPKFLGFE